MLIPIRALDQPKHPRLFDVEVDCTGKILNLDIQNVRGSFHIPFASVRAQIEAALDELAS